MRALLLALICLLPALPAVAQPVDPAKPDIVVVLLDDMRASDWRALPKTRALLEDGTWYENFILTTPQCCPSRATLLTGRYAHNHGTLDNRGENGGWRAFHAAGNEERSLAVALDATYHTALVGKYLNGFHDDGVPPGWDVWHEGASYFPEDQNGLYGADLLRDRAVAFIGDIPAGEPLFLWFAPKAPHGPAEYAPRHASAFPDTDGLDRDRLRTILAVDEAVAAIHAALGPERAERAAWFVLTDNGYLLDDEDSWSGKSVPHDAAVRVPMLARVPGASAGEDRRLAANIDLAPTIARVAGVDLLAEPDGRALQDEWDRERVLIESWNTGRNGYGPFAGVRTRCHTYLERSAERILWERCATGEERLVSFDGTQPRWAAWLDALRGCAGAACRDADGGL